MRQESEILKYSSMRQESEIFMNAETAAMFALPPSADNPGVY